MFGWKRKGTRKSKNAESWRLCRWSSWRRYFAVAFSRRWRFYRTGKSITFHQIKLFSKGVVWENSTMSTVPNFRIGGSIHLVANNQIAFTAERHIGRSSLNCTDIAKSMDCPAIHVNANAPEVDFKILIIVCTYCLGCNSRRRTCSSLPTGIPQRCVRKLGRIQTSRTQRS